MMSSYDPSTRHDAPDGPGLGTLLLVLIIASVAGGGAFVAYQQQRAAARVVAEARLAQEMAQQAQAEANSRRPPDPPGDSAGSAEGIRPDRLLEENRRLRAEVEALRRQLAEARGEDPEGSVPTSTPP